MTLFIAALSSFIAVYAGGITLNAPRKFLIPAGIGGVICWVVYVGLLPFTNNTLATFLSSISVAIYSNIMARYYKTPVTMFFIPGFLPTVPGVSIYLCVYYYINGISDKFNHYLSQTLQAATVIALSIIIVDGLFRSGARLQNLLTKQKNLPD